MLNAQAALREHPCAWPQPPFPLSGTRTNAQVPTHWPPASGPLPPLACRDIRAIVEGPPAQLVEAVAERIASTLLQVRLLPCVCPSCKPPCVLPFSSSLCRLALLTHLQAPCSAHFLPPLSPGTPQHYPTVAAVTVGVAKPHVAVGGVLQSLGVEVTRRRMAAEL